MAESADGELELFELLDEPEVLSSMLHWIDNFKRKKRK